MNLSPAKRVPMLVCINSAEDKAFVSSISPVLKSLAKLSEIEIFEDDAQWSNAAQNASVLVMGEARICLFVEIDKGAETQRLSKEFERLSQEINKAQQKLSNETFVSKAPPQVIEQERNRIKEFSSALTKVSEQLARLKA
jgi:valyl-tRNA synthetase